ncbi:HNH endonuclease signature motif containing protein, partial [Nocardioides sp.]|uniref:HNH endonuclease signature motif containing protein n=1 Tax=Nocardioides sp. TaxID=35761 RepID=UPI0027335746
TVWEGRYGDTGIPVAGPGAPLIAEFSVVEFAAALGVPTEVGKQFLGHAVELAHRLPRTWARVVARDLPAWRARRIAHATTDLSPEAAAFVDRHIGPVAHKTGPAQLDRLIDEAIARFMPQEAERRRQDAADGRCLDINDQQVSFNGTCQVHGELDLADALDLQAAVTTGAEQLKALGSSEPLDVRRSQAAGQLARNQLTLNLNPENADAEEQECADLDGRADGDTLGGRAGRSATVSRPGPQVKPRQVVLYAHISEAALHPGTTGDSCGCGRGRGLDIARVEGHPMVLADQVRDWCANPDTQITVKPVIDLAGHIDVDAYQIPDRLADQTRLLNPTCVFPSCRRPARHCDLDHNHPYAQGGRTCSCQLAPLCRRHHRAKTFDRWRYQRINPTTFIWTSPHGLMFHRDHHGTTRIGQPGTRDGCQHTPGPGSRDRRRT